MEGCFIRANGAMIQSGKLSNQLVSVVGTLPSGGGGGGGAAFDGQTLRLVCADSVEVRINVTDPTDAVPPDADQTMALEIMGLAQENGTVQHFLTRKLGPNLDMAVYNQVITDVMAQNKYADYVYVP